MTSCSRTRPPHGTGSPARTWRGATWREGIEIGALTASAAGAARRQVRYVDRIGRDELIGHRGGGRCAAGNLDPESDPPIDVVDDGARLARLRGSLTGLRDRQPRARASRRSDRRADEPRAGRTPRRPLLTCFRTRVSPSTAIANDEVEHVLTDHESGRRAHARPTREWARHRGRPGEQLRARAAEFAARTPATTSTCGSSVGSWPCCAPGAAGRAPPRPGVPEGVRGRPAQAVGRGEGTGATVLRSDGWPPATTASSPVSSRSS